MKFSPEYKDDWHRKNIDKVASQQEKMEINNGRGPVEIPTAVVLSSRLFNITNPSEEEIRSIKNLFSYVLKHHIHATTRGLTEKKYKYYLAHGAVLDKDGVTVEESTFEAGHELPHYMISWLLNSTFGVNDNSMKPSYIVKVEEGNEEIDKSMVRREFLEEVYATILSFNEYQRGNIFNELSAHKSDKLSFEKATLRIVEGYIDIQTKNELEYNHIPTTKANQDANICKERMEEVLTSTEEEREKLKEKYPLECFMYDVSHAYYYDRNTDPRAVWNVYQKYFKRLFEKANANPHVFSRKEK